MTTQNLKTVAADLRPEIIEAYRAARENGESNADLAGRLGITTNVLTRVGIREKLSGDSLAASLVKLAAGATTDEGRLAFATALAEARYVGLKSIPYLSVASGVSDGAVRTMLESVAEPTATPEDSRVGYAILAARREAKAKTTETTTTETAKPKAAKKAQKGRKTAAKKVGKSLGKGEVA